MVWSRHRWLREVLPWVLLLTFLGLFAGFTWLTRHPETEVLRQAENWPGLGPLATTFRQKYMPPSEPADGMGDSESIAVERSWEHNIEHSLRPPGEPMWLLPGAVLRRHATHDAPIIKTLDSVSNVVRLEQRDRWYRIYHHGVEAWVYLENYSSEGPPYGEEPEAPGPLPGRSPNSAELAAAQELLGEAAEEQTFGDYTVYTDCRDPALLAYLDNLARRLEAAYVGRYDLRPVGSPMAVIVLYRREEDYRRLRDQLRELAGLPASGHHSRGLIALYVGERSQQGVGSTLVHELVHTLNRRALGPALPPWLDEGLADDLAAARIAEDGRFVVDELNGRVRPEDGHVAISGALGALLDLRRAQVSYRLPAVLTVMGLDWERFVRSADIGLHYDVSAFWVRYLMQGQSRRHRQAFQHFLASVASGGAVSSEALLTHLATDISLLEAGFRSWLEFLAQEAQLPPVLGPEVPSSDDVSGSSSRQTESPSP